MDLESEAVDNADSFHVYADSCLVCNQQCYLRPSYPSDNNSRLAESERERIVEIRGIIYQAFDIQVGKNFLEDNRSELPLCPKCTFKLGQLRHVHYQLAALQREYNKLREEIAFSIVDLVAGSEGSKSYLADIGSKSPTSFLQCMKESEVDTIQHLVFENWHERYSDDDPGEESKPEYELPNLKSGETKQTKPSTSQNAGSKSKHEAAAASVVDSQTVLKSKSVPPSSASTSIKTVATASSSSNSVASLKSDITPNTKVISITTATDTTQASVEVSNEDQEVQDINRRRARTEDPMGNVGHDDGNMVIAMSPTQFCGASECSSPDPTNFLQEIDNSENEMDGGDEEDILPFKARQFEKIKVEPNRGTQYSKSLKFPNDLEITEWSSDESQQRGLDYDIFDNDDGSQDLEGMVDEAGNPLRGNREGDMTVDNNSLGNIEFQQNEEGLYVCMFCSKTFIHKYPYRDHLKTHTGEGPRCPLCNKIFPKNHNLMLHMRTHTGEKPYKCLVCGKGFADKSNLKVHMRVHTGERPYKCEYCDQAFVNSSRLVVHRRLHTGEKPFVCDLCNRCFGTGNQLATHRKIHYEEKMFKCDECGKGYTSAVTLQAHVALAH